MMDDMQREELESVIWGMVDSLPGNQGAVLRGRFLQGQTLKEVGDKIGMTAERTRTMQNNALRELRQGENRRVLSSFWEGSVYNAALHGSGVERFNQTWTSSTERVALGL